ncbi:alpha,alpha-trehalose-phosphate synthase-like protein subunit Tps2 [Microthyrium microscopicum]|uniref:Alpha,alpha-trehalose-phosphate synthase-like protein subunit Tps2 n=1 Tax=Microthyrium microscopicum TaxID=703497 RepID=A0A6A6TZN6_9PEZI|nr:alpha,alpha-trehalose-phosphate synthase-like protein subunit Tps2 [Microthyrium microscopicum]
MSESPAFRGKSALESPISTKSPPPVTPGVDAAGFSAYTERQNTPLAKPFHRPHHDADSYFGGSETPRPVSPTMVAAGAKSPEELLRRLSLSKSSTEGTSSRNVDPRAAHPNLNLSGRILSATFVVPFNIKFINDNQWELGQRKGTSALFDSFSYLSSPESKWDHTLIGWTGEITQVTKNRRGLGAATLNDAQRARLRAAAPVPVDPKQKQEAFDTAEVQIPASNRASLERMLEKHANGKYVPVWLADKEEDQTKNYVLKDQRRWTRYSQHELYNLFHYIQNEPGDGRSARKAWADYYKMNRLFADRILDIYKPGDIVVVHDHQLLLLPSLLRQKIPSIYVGFFLHIPFPSSELYRCLSQRKELLEGVLGANMVGFQSYSYSRHFSSCCTRILGFDSSSAGVDAYGAHVAVDVFPIGINAAAIRQAAFDNPSVEDKLQRIRQIYAGKKVIIGRDRLDTVRGVAQKLQAFEKFLEANEQWRDKVVLIQITSASERNPDQEKADKKYVNKIANLVSRINGKYGSMSSSPVQHFPQYLDRDEYLALLRIADLGLITSVRDGMNTTSLEYVICQKDNHGPLILSEFSGTAGSLAHAIHVNPWDSNGVADAIKSALTTPKEIRRQQHEKLYNHVFSNDTQAWTSKFLGRLLTNLSSFDQSFATPLLDRTRLLETYRSSKKRLFMFDYDGTLTPIVKDPMLATPSDRVLRNLKQLAEDPNNEVWIISGRDQAFLDEWMGHLSNLGLSAEHGSFLRSPRSDKWENVAGGMDMTWRNEVKEIFESYTERTLGSALEIKKVALTWHYRGADPVLGEYHARKCQRELEDKVARNWDVEVMTGKANLEVRPRFVNKGEIAKRLVNQYFTSSNGVASPIADCELGFVLCLGDDFTDEDMFRSLRQSKLPADYIFSVTVGASSKQTLASWHLLEPSDVISVLGLLNGNAKDQGNLGALNVVEGKIPDASKV